MKALFELLATICFFLSAIFFSACKNSVDEKSYEEMIVQFDSNNFTPYSKPAPDFSITASGFVASDMLEPRYFLKEGFNTSLIAPTGGASYKWELVTRETDGRTGEKTEVRTVMSNERIFAFVPGEDFAVGTEHKLVLTVTDSSGTEYIDTTIIIITSWE